MMNNQINHPIQPLYLDKNGVLRFKENAIVRFLLDNGPHDLNTLALEKFSQEDEEQFAQLIGYSLSGFGDLSYVSDETYYRADTTSQANKRNLSLFFHNVGRIMSITWKDNPIVRWLFFPLWGNLLVMAVIWEGLHFIGSTQERWLD
jgi:hypothetical protein